jgi:hypothetical protein
VQWRDQMRDKFGLEFRIVDSQLTQQISELCAHSHELLRLAE